MPQRPLRVYMMDLLPTVPYYTGTLGAAMRDLKRDRSDPWLCDLLSG